MNSHIWFLSIPIGAFVLLPLFKKWWQRARDDRIGQRAESQGWTVTRNPELIEWCSQLPGSHYRGVSQIMSRTENGWPVSVAEYSYYDGSGEGETKRHYVVTHVRLTSSYPPVAVERRGGISRVGRAVFGDNAASTGNEDFDRQFRVKTDDPAGHALVGPALIAEQFAGRIPTWSLAGPDLVTWQKGKLGDLSRIQPVIDGLIRVAGLIGH